MMTPSKTEENAALTNKLVRDTAVLGKDRGKWGSVNIR